MCTLMFIWYVGSQFLDQRPCNGKCLFGLFQEPPSLIELTQCNANTPQQRSQPLCMRSFLRGSQHRFRFCHPFKRRQGLTAQFPEAGNDILVRQIGGTCDQPIGDGERRAGVTASKSEGGTCSPDEPLPAGLPGSIGVKRGSQERFG